MARPPASIPQGTPTETFVSAFAQKSPRLLSLQVDLRPVDAPHIIQGLGPLERVIDIGGTTDSSNILRTFTPSILAVA